MEKTFHIFIIYHKNIYDKCYQHISQEDLDKHFTFIAVDETITKTYTPNKYNIIKEWELPIYNPELRKNKLVENSAIYHIFINQIYKQYDFIGFFHYDMPFLTNVVEDIKNGFKNNIKAFYGKNLYHVPGEYIMHTGNYNNYIWPNEPECSPMLEYYETYFNKKILKKSIYPYCNAYIIETTTFNKVMSWIVTTYNKVEMTDITAGVYERLMGISIGEENTFNKIALIDILHDRSINVFV
jgi:hypothetical protein